MAVPQEGTGKQSEEKAGQAQADVPETTGLARQEVRVGYDGGNGPSPENNEVRPNQHTPKRGVYQVQADDERDEPERVIDPESEQGLDPEVVDDDVERRVREQKEVHVRPQADGEHDPIGGEYPQKPPEQKIPRALNAGSERESHSAQDDEQVDPDITMQKVLPNEDASRVIEDDQQDCGAFQLVDCVNTTAADFRYLEIEGCHRAGVIGAPAVS